MLGSLSMVFLAVPIYTLTLTIDHPVIEQNKLTLDATCSGATAEYYLQGALRKVGTSQYFGATQNTAGDWVDYLTSPDKDYITTNFLVTNVVDATWSAQVKMQFSSDDPLYLGPGEYELKLRRFTGKSTSPAGESNALVVALSPLKPTPTPSPTPTKTPSPTPISSPSFAPSPTVSPSPLPSILVVEDKVATIQGITTTSFSPSPAQSPSVAPIPVASKSHLPTLLIMGTGLLVISAGLYLYSIIN